MSPGNHEPAIEHLLRERAPQVCGAIERRRGYARGPEGIIVELAERTG